jgi:hypothetical protein
MNFGSSSGEGGQGTASGSDPSAAMMSNVLMMMNRSSDNNANSDKTLQQQLATYVGGNSGIESSQLLPKQEDDASDGSHGGMANEGMGRSGLEDPDFPDPDGQHHPIAEFLYQLTKMLTDDNAEVVEWVDGRIKVHFPERLEQEVVSFIKLVTKPPC